MQARHHVCPKGSIASVPGRLARTDLEASVDRLRAEPGTSAESVSRFSSILATSLRLAHALMALEAGLHSGIPAPPQEPFNPSRITSS